MPYCLVSNQRRWSLIGLFFCLVGLGLSAVALATPNIIVIFCDDLGYGDLGCFGHPTIATPNIDRMASEGQKWTEFYVASSVCTPSRAALQTGRYPIRSGLSDTGRRVLFPDSTGGLPASETTIAELLKQKDYATHAIGKWHLGHLPAFLPTSHGYDSYFGIPYSNDMDRVESAPAGKESIFEPKTEYFDVPLMRGEEVIERPAEQHTLTRRYTEEAIQLIKSSTEKPFFIYLAHNLPHVPLFASDDFTGTSRRGLYGDVIEEIDWSVGQILNTLRELKIAENTMVVFTSDNGPWLSYQTHGGSAGLLRDGKGSTWEGGMRVPTVFWWPGKVKPAVISEIGSTLDILPTCAKLAEISIPEDLLLDGFDLTPTLFEVDPSPRKGMIYYRGDEVFALRSGMFKAHWKTQTAYVGQNQPEIHEAPLLFHLGHDPGEAFDVAADNSSVIAELEQLRDAHLQTIQPVEDQLSKR